MVWGSALVFLFLLILGSFSRIRLDLTVGAGGVTADFALRFLDGWIPLKADASFLKGQGARFVFSIRVGGKHIPLLSQDAKKGRKSRTARYLLRRIRIRQAAASALIGVPEDAAATALCCGLALSLLETGRAYLLCRDSRTQVKLTVTPSYQKPAFSLHIGCIIQLRTGHIIFAVLLTVFDKVKGALAQWVTQLKTSWLPQWKTLGK